MFDPTIAKESTCNELFNHVILCVITVYNSEATIIVVGYGYVQYLAVSLMP